MCKTDNLYLWLLQIIGLLGLLALCLWLSLRPKNASYTIVGFSIPKLANHNASPPVASQDGNFSYTLEIANPNKDSSIFYDDILLTFYYKQDINVVGKSAIPSFHQGKDKKIQVMKDVNADPRVWSDLLSAVSNATTELNVVLSTRIQYKTLGVRSKYHVINLQGTLPIGSDGKISGKKKKVKLHHISKK